MAHDDMHEQQQLPNAIEASQFGTLPTQIVVEILLKLRVESLLRCKSVCKLWCSLISDSRFVASHLNLSAHRRLIFTTGSILNTCCLNDVMDGNNTFNALEEVDYPLKSTTQRVSVVDSINGLLCLRVYMKNDNSHHEYLFLCNPSTRKFTTLLSDAYRTNVEPVKFGFGYDQSTDDYKVVSFSTISRLVNRRCEHETLVKIYSLKNGGWKDFGAFPHGLYVGLLCKFLNGALHWASRDDGDHWKIVSLDLATEAFGEVTQPVYDEDKIDHMTMGILGEWLCVLCDHSKIRVDVWAMKVYGVKDSWTKLFSIPNMHNTPYLDLCLELLCTSSDGRILLSLVNKLKIYDSKDSSFSDVQNFDKHMHRASTFVESLVSLMPPAS